MLFEKCLIEQCAPTLASLKTGNLFNISYQSLADLENDVLLWNKDLNSKGVKIDILKVNPISALVYVYRVSELKKDLSSSFISEFLLNYGYETDNLEEIIHNLKIRMEKYDDFPHEIGLFLGYPLSDVEGFICNKGKNCSHCGYWKVYSNPNESLKKFALYDKCKNIYQSLWEEGRSVLQLTA